MNNLYNTNEYYKQKNNEQFIEHFFTQYKLFIEMADRISSRRQKANSFFLTLNIALISIIGYENIEISKNLNQKGINKIIPLIFITISGIILSYSWIFLIFSYKKLNSAKFKIINNIEKYLPINLYNQEWEILKKNNYSGLNQFEMFIPLTFNLLYYLYICFLMFCIFSNMCLILVFILFTLFLDYIIFNNIKTG